MSQQANVSQDELKYFRIEISSKYIKIFPLLEKFKTQILIEKRTAKVLLADKSIVYQEQQSTKQVEVRYASLVLGIISIQNQRFLVFAKSVYPQPQLPSHFKIYQIAQIQFIPLSIIMSQTKQMLQIIEKVFEIFSFSFYFSFQRDLTLSFQQFYNDKMIHPKSRYFWNQQMLSHLICSQIDDKTKQNVYNSEWCIPIIQGYYGYFDYVQKQNYNIEIFLISRRSKYRSGTRFYNRGIDQSGSCANFIESQLVLVYNNTLISTKYYSGSVPLFWQQISQLSKVKITRDRELGSLSYRKHMKSMITQNQHVILINLLQKKKQNQYILIKQYEHHVQSNIHQFQQNLKYSYFDINYYDKSQSFQKIWQFVEDFFEISQSFKSFQINLKTNVIYSVQRGTYRVSCLDCLARTNKFMRILALQSLYINLQKINFFKQSFKQLAIQLLSQPDEKLNPFLSYYKSIWGQKGQFESIIYAGSSSTQTKKTKFLDKIQNTIISLQRYYNQKFIDQVKQKSLDAILYHKNYQPIFRAKHKIPFNVSIVTWNVNATDPQKLGDLPKVIQNLQKSDLIVIGIQQMIELNTNNVMNDNTEESKYSSKWKQAIQICLNNKNMSQQYIFVQKLEMVGLFLIMFINKKWIHSLKSVHKDIVKTGIKIGVSQKYGNKGGIVIRISIYETTLSFICAHLAAHQNKTKQRINDLLQIHKKAFQQNKQSIQNELEIDFSDYNFFFGDLNFRLNGEFSEIKQLIEKSQNKSSYQKQQIYQSLMKHDQLYELMNSQSGVFQNEQIPQYFRLYRQPSIQFYPTYKLDKHTGQYSLQKSRIPSYCDRILFWKNYQFQQLNVQTQSYSDIKAKGSDHRPVCGKFVVNILKQTKKQRQSIILEESYFQESQIKSNNEEQIFQF